MAIESKSLLTRWLVEKVSHPDNKHVTSVGAKNLDEEAGRAGWGYGKGQGRQALREGVHCSRVVREGLSDEMTLERKLSCHTGTVSLPRSFLLHLEQHPRSLPAGLSSPALLFSPPSPLAALLPFLHSDSTSSFPLTFPPAWRPCSSRLRPADAYSKRQLGHCMAPVTTW